jgi:hypothetical protein
MADEKKIPLEEQTLSRRDLLVAVGKFSAVAAGVLAGGNLLTGCGAEGDIGWSNNSWSNEGWSNEGWSNEGWSNGSWSNATWSNATWRNYSDYNDHVNVWGNWMESW